MDIIFKAVTVFVDQFLTKPEVLLALVVMLGYLLLKRPADRVISGTIKTAVGIMILNAGAGLLVQNFQPVTIILKESLGLEGYILDPYAGMPAAMNALGGFLGNVGYTLLIGFAINLLLVRFTKFKAIYLTGHVMYISSVVMTWMVLHLLGLNSVATVIISGVLLGLYWTIFSHLLIRPTAAITTGNLDAKAEDATFTLGHVQMLADLLAFKFGKKVGKPENNVEKLNLPSWLNMFQDNVVAVSVIMTIFTSVFLLIAGVDAIKVQAGDVHWVLYLIQLGLSFAVAITIILTGVRMFMAELVPAFKGISEKILPGAIPAIDCPAVFPYAPKAVLLGFVFTVLGQILGMAILGFAGAGLLIIPGFVPLFFDGGPVGVYANASGGWKAIMVFCTLLGVLHILGAALVIPISGLAGGWIGDWDWGTLFVPVFYLMKIIGNLIG